VDANVLVLYRLERFPESVDVEESLHDMNNVLAAIHIPCAIWVVLHANVERFLRRKV
jgi:hypothetical protein